MRSSSSRRVSGARASGSAFYAKSGRVAQANAAVLDGVAHERVVFDQQVAVEVDVVGQRREVRGRGDAERRLDRAPDHDLQVTGSGDLDGLAGGGNSPALHQLDVDPVVGLGEG